MKEFVEKTKMRLCWHDYKRVEENYVYTSPVIIPKLDFDKSTGMLHMEETEDYPIKVGGETIYKCDKCGKMKIICYRKFKED